VTESSVLMVRLTCDKLICAPLHNPEGGTVFMYICVHTYTREVLICSAFGNRDARVTRTSWSPCFCKKLPTYVLAGGILFQQ
jgi:hypothetical protein